jgi:hypothetical protein
VLPCRQTAAMQTARSLHARSCDPRTSPSAARRPQFLCPAPSQTPAGTRNPSLTASPHPSPLISTRRSRRIAIRSREALPLRLSTPSLPLSPCAGLVPVRARSQPAALSALARPTAHPRHPPVRRPRGMCTGERARSRNVTGPATPSLQISRSVGRESGRAGRTLSESAPRAPAIGLQ